MRTLNNHTVTIANGESLSNTITLRGTETLLALEFPTGWTAANITFKAGFNSARNVFNNGTEYVISGIGGDQLIPMDVSMFTGVKVLAIRSGTSGSPVNQGAERIITVITGEL